MLCLDGSDQIKKRRKLSVKHFRSIATSSFTLSQPPTNRGKRELTAFNERASQDFGRYNIRLHFHFASKREVEPFGPSVRCGSWIGGREVAG